jgi:uncharacterized protein (TIGR02145 family)
MKSIRLITIFLVVVSCQKENTEPINYNGNLEYGSFTDLRDGHTYKTIKIGDQVWMAENLSYLEDQNVEDLGCIYGRFYYYSQIDEVCPDGWHVPSEEEWEDLFVFLGGKHVAGGKMKESGTSHWLEPNSSGSNSCGFSALPAGYDDWYGGYGGRGTETTYWTSTLSEDYCYSDYVKHISLTYKSSAVVVEGYCMDEDYSIRCIKNSN